MPYSFINRSQFKAALSQRLYELTPTFFPDGELNAVTNEALQSFNAHANFYREEFAGTLAQDTTWYDLTDTAVFPGTLRPLSETDADLISMMEYHLLEPQNTYPWLWSGSKQFSAQDILNAIQQVRDQVLSESNCTVTDALVAANPGRTFLSDSTIGIRRVAWIPISSPSGYSFNTLLSLDLWGQQSFEAAFPQYPPGTPLTYRRSTEPPLSFDVDIQPAVPGNYDVHTVDAGGDLSVNAATILRVPNDWCWVIKWGAMAQLFGRESNAADPLRAEYCLQRYKMGMAAMQQAPAVLGVRINDVPVVVESVTVGDLYDANWQGASAGTTTAIYYAGMNLIGASPKPDAGAYSVTLNVVRNMPLPVDDADFIQIGRDDISAVLDEAQHIAMIKCGGTEFMATFSLHANFLRHCQLYNSKLNALSAYLEFMDGLARQNQMDNPVFQGVGPGGEG